MNTGLRPLSMIVASLALAGAVAAQARLDKASARLAVAGDRVDGAYRAAIVIDLAPDTITYWRNPGEAGVPPVFDFSGSDNLARAEVALPAPTRIREAGGDVFGYAKRVAYAVTVAPADPMKPVRLVLKMDYAACEKICIPVHADLAADFTPAGKAGPEAALVAQARAAIPNKVEARDAARIERLPGADKPTWRVTPAHGDALDLFAEAPEGYFLETGRDQAGGFRLVLAERPKQGAQAAITARLTLARASGSVEFETRLDGAGPTP